MCQTANEYARFTFFLLLLHTMKKWRKTRHKTLFWEMHRRASANAACCIGQRPTVRSTFPPAASMNFTSQKMCKNVEKQPVLQGEVANNEL